MLKELPSRDELRAAFIQSMYDIKWMFDRTQHLDDLDVSLSLEFSHLLAGGRHVSWHAHWQVWRIHGSKDG